MESQTQRVKEQVGRMAGNVNQRVQQLGQKAPSMEGAQQWVKDHPMASVAGAVGTGMAAGGLIFSRFFRRPTMKERVRTAAREYADRARYQARKTGQTVAHQASQTANRAALSAREASNNAVQSMRQRSRKDESGTLSKVLYTVGGAILAKKVKDWVSRR